MFVVFDSGLCRYTTVSARTAQFQFMTHLICDWLAQETLFFVLVTWDSSADF